MHSIFVGRFSWDISKGPCDVVEGSVGTSPISSCLSSDTPAAHLFSGEEGHAQQSKCENILGFFAGCLEHFKKTLQVDTVVPDAPCREDGNMYHTFPLVDVTIFHLIEVNHPYMERLGIHGLYHTNCHSWQMGRTYLKILSFWPLKWPERTKHASKLTGISMVLSNWIIKPIYISRLQVP